MEGPSIMSPAFQNNKSDANKLNVSVGGHAVSTESKYGNTFAQRIKIIKSSTGLNSPKIIKFQSSASQNKEEKEKKIIYTPQIIQQMIENIFNKANESLRSLSFNKSSGFLTDKFKEELKQRMQKDYKYLVKLKKLAQNPFLHNDYIYNRLLLASINYFERAQSKIEKQYDDKLDWIESEYFHWLTQLLQLLQKFGIHDVVQMKKEISNIHNWYNNFVKYIESMQLLKYPSHYHKKKKSSEIKELEKIGKNFTNTLSEEKKKRLTSNQVTMSEIKQMGTQDLTMYDINKLHTGQFWMINEEQFKIGLSSQVGGEQNISLQTDNQVSSLQKINNKIENDLRFNQQTDLDLNQIFSNQIMLPKIEKRLSDVDLLTGTPNKKNSSFKSLKGQKTHRSLDTDNISKSKSQRSKHNSFEDSSAEHSNSSLIEDLTETDKKEEDAKKKYLIEAPLTFKINPPPKIIDLTSDLFEKEQDYSSGNLKPKRTINPKANAFMIEIGKKKIEQLKNFHGKMISQAMMRDFQLMFAPLDDFQDAQEYFNDKLPAQIQGGGLLPPNLVHDDMLNTAAKLTGLDKAMPDFKSTGLSIIKRTAQDDYRYQQLNEVNNLKQLLVQNGIHVDQESLQRAILMPEDVVFDQKRKMPGPGINLMTNPFPKPKKKKKRRIRRKTRTSLIVDF